MLVSKIKEIRNGRVITKDAAGDISQYKGFFIIQRGDDNNRKFVIANSNGKELLAALSITEAQGLIDSQLKNKDAVNPSNPSSVSAAKNKAVAQGQAGATNSGKMKDVVDPTKPKAIAAAKSLSVAQGKAATGDKKSKDVDWLFSHKGFDIFAEYDNGKKSFAAQSHTGGNNPVIFRASSQIELYDKIDKYLREHKAGDLMPIKRHLVRTDGGPGSGQKGHTTHHIPDPSTHQERRKERANLQKYIENARRSGNIKEAQKHSQRLAHINSLQLKG